MLYCAEANDHLFLFIPCLNHSISVFKRREAVGGRKRFQKVNINAFDFLFLFLILVKALQFLV